MSLRYTVCIYKGIQLKVGEQFKTLEEVFCFIENGGYKEAYVFDAENEKTFKINLR